MLYLLKSSLFQTNFYFLTSMGNYELDHLIFYLTRKQYLLHIGIIVKLLQEFH